MGDAKRRANRLKDMQVKWQFCIYCGGVETGTTIDHIPPKVVFDLRHRPRGLEFLSCSDCNNGSGLDDQAIGWLSRMLPDSDDTAHSAELQKLTREVFNNHPRLMREMVPSLDQKNNADHLRLHDIVPGGGILNPTGPILNDIMGRFSARLGMALHTHISGSIVPNSGRSWFRWFSNVDAIEGKVPQSFLEIVGPPLTLKQGSWSVPEQFEYASKYSQSDQVSLHFCTFRRSFSIAVIVAENGDIMKTLPPENIRQPGCLKRTSGIDR